MKEHIEFLDMNFSTKLMVLVTASDNLSGYDVNQDFVSLLESDLRRWLSTETVERLICEGGPQDVKIEIIAHESNLSDVSGE